MAARSGTRPPIRFGYKLPNCGGVLCPPEWATPLSIDALAANAVDAGFDSLWLHDHLVVPTELQHLGELDFYEPVVTMGRLAAIYPEVQIGIATVVLPLRDPVLFTKQSTTLAAFHPGRLIFGVGLGRYESESQALGLDDYNRRGKVANAWLDINEALLSQGRASIETPFRRLREASMRPKRVGTGDPAIWVAGGSAAGVERAARYGDGLIVASITPEEVSTLVAAVPVRQVEPESTASAPGRSARLTIALSATIARGAATGSPPIGHGRLHVHASAIGGEVREIAETLKAYVSAGVDHFILSFGTESLGKTREDARWFATEVAPRVRAAR